MMPFQCRRDMYLCKHSLIHTSIHLSIQPASPTPKTQISLRKEPELPKRPRGSPNPSSSSSPSSSEKTPSNSLTRPSRRPTPRLRIIVIRTRRPRQRMLHFTLLALAFPRSDLHHRPLPIPFPFPHTQPTGPRWTHPHHTPVPDKDLIQ